MKQNSPDSKRMILLVTPVILLLAYIVYSAFMQAGDLAAMNRRLDDILAMSTENRALITDAGKSNSKLAARLDALEDSTRSLADSVRLQGASGPKPAADNAPAAPAEQAYKDAGYPYASGADHLQSPRSYDRILEGYRDRIVATGNSETVADFGDRFAATESGQQLAGKGVIIESAVCSATNCLIEGDVASHPKLNYSTLSRMDADVQEDAYYAFVRDFYKGISEMGLPPNGALQRNGDKFYYYGRLTPAPKGRGH